MTIRKQILTLFSFTVISVIAIILSIIYMLFSEYREEEFQQRQKEKIKTTITLLDEIKEMNESIVEAMDKITIHDFYDEKLLVFDEHKELIFSSIDDLPINIYKNILGKLSPENTWIETYEEGYDVVGVFVENIGNNGYYGINKAYDEYGFTKLHFLRNILITSFLAVATLIIFIALYLSRKIAKPISDMANQMEKINLEKTVPNIDIPHGNQKEIILLQEKFNSLVKKTNEAFAFQKHAINHISHELKTPISIIVSNLEKLEDSDDPKELKRGIEKQKKETAKLANIINTLLILSKLETKNDLKTEKVRIDELVFDVIDEIQPALNDFSFKLDYVFEDITENNLTVSVNKELIKSAFSNLFFNAKNYSIEKEALIKMEKINNKLIIRIINKGPIILDKEEKYIFEYYFRGKNSHGFAGFGLGLVLAKRIIDLHGGSISYTKQLPDINEFKIELI